MRPWGFCSSRAHAVLIAQRRDRFLPHGLMAGLVIAAVGVPWVAQLAMRTDSATSETAWIPFPSAETVARATARRLGHRRARHPARGRRPLVPAPRREIGSRGVARDMGIRPDPARPRHLDREADLPRPLPRDHGASVRHARGRRRHGRRRPASRRSRRRSRCWRRRSGSCSGTQTADDGNWRGEDWRSAVATIMERRGDADAVVVAPWWAHDAAEYYGAPPKTCRQRIRSGFSTGRRTARRFRPTSGVRSASAITCWWRGFSSAGG